MCSCKWRNGCLSISSSLDHCFRFIFVFVPFYSFTFYILFAFFYFLHILEVENMFRVFRRVIEARVEVLRPVREREMLSEHEPTC